MKSLPAVLQESERERLSELEQKIMMLRDDGLDMFIHFLDELLEKQKAVEL